MVEGAHPVDCEEVFVMVKYVGQLPGFAME